MPKNKNRWLAYKGTDSAYPGDAVVKGSLKTRETIAEFSARLVAQHPTLILEKVEEDYVRYYD